MPEHLTNLPLVPSQTIYVMQFVCVDPDGDFLCRPATAATDPPIAVSQIGYDVPPNLVSALTSGQFSPPQVAGVPGEPVQLFHSGDVCPVLLSSGATCNPGSFLAPSPAGGVGDGAVTVNSGSGSWFGAIALQAGSASNIVDAWVHLGRA